MPKPRGYVVNADDASGVTWQNAPFERGASGGGIINGKRVPTRGNDAGAGELNMDIQSLRNEFAITRQYNFMDHAAVAPICGRAAGAMRRYIEQAEQHAYVRGGLYEEAKRVRAAAAK